MTKLWNVGINQAADAVVVSQEHVLLIKRGDNGEWAFPGGFVNPGEGTLFAAKREAEEEAGINLDNSRCVPIFEGRVEDHRNEEDRWVETDAYLFEVNEMQNVKGNDDALEASWFTLAEADLLIQTTHRPIFDNMLTRLAV